MTLKEEGFNGIIEQFKEFLYITFVQDGGMREINSNNIARELDDVWEYHIDEEEEIVQVILFYHCLVEVIGFLPDFCFNTVNKCIDRYNEIDLSGTLSSDEQTYFHTIVSELTSQIQNYK